MAILSPQRVKHIADAYLEECREHLTEPQVNELAGRLGMSAGDFSNLFLKLLGERPSAYFQRGRMDCAQRLLYTTDLTLDVIAQICGFGTVRTLHRRVKSAAGVTPQQFRRRRP